MRKYRRNKMLVVFWYDIVEESSWVAERDMDKEPDCLCVNCGFYHHHDKRFLYMSHSISSKERSKTTIPLGCIQHIETIPDAAWHKRTKEKQ